MGLQGVREVSKIELGPLPERTHFPGWTDVPYYTADQMRAYAEQEVARERERCAKLIEPKNPPDDWTEYAKICAENAARIRKGTEA